jgi:hypothetical protein
MRFAWKAHQPRPSEPFGTSGHTGGVAQDKTRSVWSREHGWHQEGPRGEVVAYTTAIGVVNTLQLICGGVGLLIATIASIGEVERAALATGAGLALGAITIVGFAAWVERPGAAAAGATVLLPTDVVPSGWRVSLREQRWAVVLCPALVAGALAFGLITLLLLFTANGLGGMAGALALRARDKGRGWALYVEAEGAILKEKPYCFKGST